MLIYDIRPLIEEFKTKEITTHNFGLDDTIQSEYSWEIKKIQAQRIIDLRDMPTKGKLKSAMNEGIALGVAYMFNHK